MYGYDCLRIASFARCISLCNQIFPCSIVLAAVCVGNSFRTGAAGIVKFSSVGIDDIIACISRRLLCRSFFLCWSRRGCWCFGGRLCPSHCGFYCCCCGFCCGGCGRCRLCCGCSCFRRCGGRFCGSRGSDRSCGCCDSAVLLLAAGGVAAGSGERQQSADQENACRDRCGTFAVFRIQFAVQFFKEPVHRNENECGNGIRRRNQSLQSPATAKQRKPLKVWAKIAITASTAETAKAIQRNVLFSIIASTSAVRAYAAVWHLCTAVSTHPPGRCICGRQSRMFLVHPEPECRRQDQGDTKPTGKGQKDNAGDYGSPKNFGAFLVSGVCPDQD